MPELRFAKIDVDLLVALERGAAELEARVGATLGNNEVTVREVVVQTLAMSVAAERGETHWGGYLAIDTATAAIIGTCAFKGAVTADGEVEIAYFTFPEFERRGYATAMAERLIAIARSSPRVRTIFAHTLPEPNASTRILLRVGMKWSRAVEDPEEGTVWRWQC